MWSTRFSIRKERPPKVARVVTSDLYGYNRKEKSLRHVAMVAKFLDDNKAKTSLKKWICPVLNFIDLIQFHLICKILAKLSEKVNFLKNCENAGEILKISCWRCHFVKFDTYFLGFL